MCPVRGPRRVNPASGLFHSFIFALRVEKETRRRRRRRERKVEGKKGNEGRRRASLNASRAKFAKRSREQLPLPILSPFSPPFLSFLSCFSPFTMLVVVASLFHLACHPVPLLTTTPFPRLENPHSALPPPLPCPRLSDYSATKETKRRRNKYSPGRKRATTSREEEEANFPTFDRPIIIFSDLSLSLSFQIFDERFCRESSMGWFSLPGFCTPRGCQRASSIFVKLLIPNFFFFPPLFCDIILGLDF